MAVIAGPAIAILFENNLLHFPDCTTYLGLAHFDFAQSPVRRYRVIVPFAAAALNFLFGRVFTSFSPSYFNHEYSLAFSFFVVNVSLTALFGLLVYRYCKAFDCSRTSALIGTLAMLTCRYTIYMAALPLVDSLFCVIIALALLGIKEKNTGMLLWAILLGPFAKEAFVFIAPLVFFFSHIEKKKQVLCFVISGAIVFTYRFLYDHYAPLPSGSGLDADMSHLPNIIHNLPKLFSVGTLFKILMNVGFWALVPVLVFLISKARGMFVVKALDKYLFWFVLTVIVQMLLSGSMERMFYLAMPVVCVVVALSVDELAGMYRKAGAKGWNE